MAIVKKRTASGEFLGYWSEEQERWATQAEYEATYAKEGPGDEEEDDVDYEELNKTQIGQLLTERGVDFSPHLTKQQLKELHQAGRPAKEREPAKTG